MTQTPKESQAKSEKKTSKEELDEGAEAMNEQR